MATLLRRDSLMMTTSAGSGHPTSCLSCAELMSVIYFDHLRITPNDAQNPDNDEFIMSKGHAAPILYASLQRAGCIDQDITTLRQFDSPLEGHPVPASLDWIKVATGSLGQGLANGVGMALAAKLSHRSFDVTVLMGDSEIAEGSVYEALDIAMYYKLDNLIAIVDVNRLGQTGETMYGHHIASYKKRFKGFGAHVYVIDGHDVGQIQKTLRKAREIKKPVVILAKTYKGQGVSFIKDKTGWHGKALNGHELVKALRELPMHDVHLTPHKPHTKHPVLHRREHSLTPTYALGEKIATRQAYGHALEQLAQGNDYLVALDAEVKNSTFTAILEKKFPRKVIQTFIAEQGLIGVAAGLSAKGFDTFSATFAAFLSRAHDQLRMSALSSLSMVVCGSHSGVSIGEDGASQMGLEDLALFRSLHGSSVFYPSDATSALRLVELAAKTKGVSYVRTSRPKTPVLYDKKTTFTLGGFHIHKAKKKATGVIAASGVTLHEALNAQQQLAQENIHVDVVDCYCLKPFDDQKFARMLNYRPLVVVEDHHPEGGLGELILSRIYPDNSQHLAVRKLPHSGTEQQLLAHQEINANSIIKAVKKVIA